MSSLKISRYFALLCATLRYSKLSLIGILVFQFSQILAQSERPYYYYKSSKIYLDPQLAKVFVLFKDAIKNSDIDVLKKLNLESMAKVVQNQKEKLSNKRDIAWVELELLNSPNSVTTRTLINELNKNTIVSIANPAYKFKNEEVGLSHIFHVKLKSKTDFEVLKKIALATQTEIGEQHKFMPLWYTLYASKNSKGNSLEMSNFFSESGYFDAAEPSFVYKDPFSANASNPTGSNESFEDKKYNETNVLNCPTDPDFNFQWGLKNDGQNLNQLGINANFSGVPGIDIKICDARDITRSVPNIIVAVIDASVQETHPDLINNIVQGFNLDNNTPGILPPVDINHGTAVAGIIAASDNNQIGVSGVAPKSKIMSVAFGPGFNGIDEKLSNGLIWAANNSASVINNSWWYPSPVEMIDDAIAYAITYGRNGLGSVVVFAAGNGDESSVKYPANDPNVMAVGAITPCGKRPDESFNCNNATDTRFGDSLDIVAPGVLIWTTDLTGADGTSTGDYTRFSATSAACPHVAGIAALILSVNPCLTQIEVRQIIESTAQKVNQNSPYSYTNNANHPNGTWNNEMGHGLADANAAVIEARRRLLLSVNKPNGIFSISNAVSGIISGNIVYGSNSVVLSHDDIRIPSGSKLTVNGTLVMATGKSIIVEQNGELLVEGGTITALCGMWGGIQVRGDGPASSSSTYRGKANLTNATIEFALNALTSHNLNNPYSSSGGMVGASKTIFRNNKQDINIWGWNNTGLFQLCTFEINNSYRHNSIEPRVLLTNSNYTYSTFSGCKFINNYTGDVNSLGYPSENWVGVKCYDCGLYIEKNYADGIITQTSFEKFYFGVHLIKLSQDNLINIFDGVFRGNFTGIYSEGVNYLTAFNNVFWLGGINPFPAYEWYRTGITVNTGTGFTLQQNSFTSSNNAPYPFGTLILDTGSDPNKIISNNYSNLFASNRVLGNNRGFSTGLGLSCNVNNSNVYDNVIEYGQGIAMFQGSLNRSDGNSFSNNGDAVDYYNDSNNPIFRFYTLGGRSYATSGGASPIYQTLVSRTGSQCFLSGLAPQYIMSLSERVNLISEFNSKSESLKSLNSKYSTLIDAGNTAALVNTMKTNWSKDAMTLRKNLLANSPNLSEDVLLEVANTGILSADVLMEILLSNINSSQNKLFLEKLMSSIPRPLSVEQINKLKSAPVPPSVRFDLEVQINELKEETMDIGKTLVTDILKSKDKYPVDSLRFWFRKLNSPHAYYSLAETFIQYPQSADFEKSLKNLENDFTDIKKNKGIHEAYTKLYSLKSEVFRSGRDLKKLNDSEIGEIRIIAKSSNSEASVIANNILCYALGECRSLKVPRIKEQVQLRNSVEQGIVNKTEKKEMFLRAFPNPARENVTLEFYLAEIETNIDIVVTTIAGTEITRSKLKDNETGRFTWQTEGLSSGVYFISIESEGKHLLSQKVTLIK